jgi:hypothetical protein
MIAMFNVGENTYSFHFLQFIRYRYSQSSIPYSAIAQKEISGSTSCSDELLVQFTEGINPSVR